MDFSLVNRYQIGEGKFEWTSNKRQGHVKQTAYTVKIERISDTITIIENDEVLLNGVTMQFDPQVSDFNMAVTDGLFVAGTPDLLTNTEIGFNEYPDVCMSNLAIDGTMIDFKKVQNSVTVLPGGEFNLDC